MNLNMLPALYAFNSNYETGEYCIVNGNFMKLNEIENLNYSAYTMYSYQSIPYKLYKYFPNKVVQDQDLETGEMKDINYSIEALKNNTVFLQSPEKFDDIYDSDITLDYSVYYKYRLLSYCKCCNIPVHELLSINYLQSLLISKIAEAYTENKDLITIFTQKPFSKMQDLTNEVFCLRFQKGYSEYKDFNKALASVLSLEYIDYSQQLQTQFRVSCFTTDPLSQLMWGNSYADFHCGFCIEYTINRLDPKYKDIIHHIYPMIYCKSRPDMTRWFARLQERGMCNEQDLWFVYYYGALRKSIDWAFQNEWRLLLPPNFMNVKNYNIPFFPITKVFLGNRMTSDKRDEIISICKKRNIPYVGVIRNPRIYEMQECPLN